MHLVDPMDKYFRIIDISRLVDPPFGVNSPRVSTRLWLKTTWFKLQYSTSTPQKTIQHVRSTRYEVYNHGHGKFGKLDCDCDGEMTQSASDIPHAPREDSPPLCAMDSNDREKAEGMGLSIDESMPRSKEVTEVLRSTFFMLSSAS